MLPWHEFAEQAPSLAERGRERLAIGIAYLATVRPDGAPRLHPVSPIFTADGRLLVAVGDRSPKRLDLAGDGRYAMHALPLEDTAAWAAAREAAGHVVRDVDWLFEFLIERALTSRWFGLGVPGQTPTNQQFVWRLGWDAPRERSTVP